MRFTWRAVFEDNTVISQTTKTDKDIPFNAVIEKEKESDLVWLSYIDSKDKIKIAVNLKTFNILLNEVSMFPSNFDATVINNVRPIIFRRNEMWTGGGDTGQKILMYAIGMQATTKDEENIQCQFHLYPEDGTDEVNVVFGINMGDYIKL
jgi:hypothetical protein